MKHLDQEEPENVFDDPVQITNNIEEEKTISGPQKSSWKPPHKENLETLSKKVAALQDMRKPKKKQEPLKKSEIKLENLKSEKHLDSNTNMKTALDSKTNLNGLNFGCSIKKENGQKEVKSTSSLFDGLYSNEDGDQEQNSSKRKHSSTASECNFSLEDDFIVDDELLAAPKPKATVQQKLSKFRRTEDTEQLKETIEPIKPLKETIKPTKPLKESVLDNLPNLTGLGDEVSKDPNENTLTLSRRDVKMEKENSEDLNLHKMLEKRRKKDEKISNGNEEMFPESDDDELSKIFDEPPKKVVPDTPDKFGDDEDDEFLSNLDFSDLDQKPNISTKKPLFADSIKSNACKIAVNPIRSFPAAAKNEKESCDMFDSEDDEIFMFDEKKQVKASLSSADEIDEPEEPIRKVKVVQKKSMLKRKGGLSLKKKARISKSMIYNSDDEDDFR